VTATSANKDLSPSLASSGIRFLGWGNTVFYCSPAQHDWYLHYLIRASFLHRG